jgi:hypothetical protein
MKRLVLLILGLTLAAAPARAYIQLGHLPPEQQPKQDNATLQKGGISGTDFSDSGLRKRRDMIEVPKPLAGPLPLGEPVTRPIPEPGTMALTSLGLLALGAAGHRRRGN